MIYLDNAATSFPKPKGMTAAMTGHMLSWCGNPGRGGHTYAQKSADAVYKTRCELADFLQINNPDRIIFTQNATAALNMAISGVLRKGDHVVTTSMEHNAVLRPVAASGAEYTIVNCHRDGSLDTADIERAIKQNTRLIVCTHVSNVTGTIMPINRIAQICKRKGLLLLVDASQSVGHLPLTAAGIDMLAAPGHKGLMGPMGTGFLYAADHVKLKPLIYGGTGTRSKELMPENEFPSSYEAGTVNVPGIVGLGYSLGWIRRQGVEQIYEQQMQLTRAFDECLKNMPGVVVYGPDVYRNKVGITAFNIKEKHCSEVASLLNDDFGIAVRAGYHCAALAHKTIGTWDTGAVRVSAGSFTTMRQIQYAADAVYRIVKQASGARPSRYSPAHQHGCSFR